MYLHKSRLFQPLGSGNVFFIRRDCIHLTLSFSIPHCQYNCTHNIQHTYTKWCLLQSPFAQKPKPPEDRRPLWRNRNRYYTEHRYRFILNLLQISKLLPFSDEHWLISNSGSAPNHNIYPGCGYLIFSLTEKVEMEKENCLKLFPFLCYNDYDFHSLLFYDTFHGAKDNHVKRDDHE